MTLPVLDTSPPAHVIEALFAVQAARRALAAGRAALGPVRGAHELWARLDALVGQVDSLGADLQMLGQTELSMHDSHSGAGCPLCSPSREVPTYTGGRR